MPFIIFISAMWFFISIKQNNELLTLKVLDIQMQKVIALSTDFVFLGPINFNNNKPCYIRHGKIL